MMRILLTMKRKKLKSAFAWRLQFQFFVMKSLMKKDEIESNNNKSIDNIENDDDIPQEFEGENDLNKDQINLL